MPSSDDMIAPTAVVPQIPAPSQNRQTGAVRKDRCQRSPSWWRLADSEDCTHGSQASRKLRGVASAMKSRLAPSLPNRPQRMIVQIPLGQRNSLSAARLNGLRTEPVEI